MAVFTNVDDLIRVLRYEVREPARFPVRFILVKGLSAWKDIIDRLKLEVDATLELSFFCKDQDVFPYLPSLIRELKDNGKKKILILPLSECLRLIPSSSSILRELAVLENVGQSRVYIPLLEIEDIFVNEMEKIDRYRQGLLPAAWVLKGEGAVKVRAAPFRLKSEAGKIVAGIKRYLQVWEKGGRDDIYLVSQLAPYLNSIIGNFEVRIYKNAFEFARGNLSGITDACLEWGEDNQWRWLIEEREEQEEFSKLAASIFNVNKFDPWQLYSRWETFEANEKWLLWLWSKLEAPPGTYLHLALKDSTSVSHIEENIANGVFKYKLEENLLKERKALLEGLRLKEMPSSFWLAFHALNDPLEKIKALTGLTTQEKENVILVVQDLIQKGIAKESWWPFLEIAYPELSYYLTPCQFEDDFISTYFRHYVTSRVLDKPLAELLDMARKAAEEKKIWSLATQGSLLEKYSKDDIKTIWVDGMGLEWCGLIRGLINNRYDNVKIEVFISRAYLPTTTELNKGWEKEEDVERRLDDLAHKYNYRFPRFLSEEIDIIKNMVERAVQLLRQYTEVIITADHGLTRFAYYGGSSQIPEDARVHRWGRYAELKDSSNTDTEYPSTTIVENGNLITAVHEKFKGGRGAIGEVHGGATLEECLVPLIRIWKAKETSQLPGFELVTPVIKLNVYGEGQMIVTVSEPIRILKLKVAGMYFLGNQTVTGNWSISIKNLKTGEHRAALEYEDGVLGEIRFKVIKGLMLDENMGL
ncbi:BREX-4 system phosphatase PglZ [Moorella sulfitireducens (nom. illeg.)]|uniref:BREX-4 system phosphatase PglZ n=1 Tax=Neomoorella sulfitireducens TaxID=2972948 RepID=UPI0021ABC4EF|nr:BREX-4 system phosphatase PglZ [Moorella sulfitireducens]